ncbi:MAG TPA: C25 family cysteine peptidase [Cyclobacteriaceae bacterium]|nr:C25 family cysteine peptidase [Cyclobacteriaceae bacterium]
MGLKRWILIIGISFTTLQSFAQVGSEWINFNQFYYKIPVAKNGIYRLTYSNLQNAGFPVDVVDPRRLQLYHRGVEQAIYVDGESDAKFDAADFIEFYGQRNDGTMDGELYRPSTLQPHTYINLFSDTTSYFLTFNPLPVLGSRMFYSTEINVGGIPKESFHNEELLTVLSDGGYWGGVTYGDYIHNSFFDETEGWSGVEIRQGSFLDYTITNAVHGDATNGKPQLELLLIGRNLESHETVISVGSDPASLRTASTVDFFGFTTSKVTIPLEWTDISSGGKITIRVSASGVGGQPDRISVSYLKINFPQTFSSDGLSEKVYTLAENSSDKSYIEIQNPASNLRLFDVTDPNNVVRIRVTSTTTLNAVIPSTSSARKVLSTNVVLTPAQIKKVTFRQTSPGLQDYIIISNKQLRKSALGYADPVKAYGDYRASTAGGGYDTLIVDINQLYDQYNYGEVSPLAIFHFMKFLCSVKPPKYLFIIGKGLLVNYNTNRQPTLTKFKDLVPTSGYPGSDMFFTVGLAGTQNEPAVPTGRITASTPNDVAAYLNKVKEMEALPFDGLWRKNLLHLSGGIRVGEPEQFRAYMQDFQKTAEGYHLGGSVQAIAKKSTDIKLINVSTEVNKGLNLVTFYGHSSPGATDFEIGFASDPVMGYNNPGKYPTLLMNGCNVGSFFLDASIFGEDWVNTPGKGAIGFIADASYGFENLLKKYSDVFYEVGYGDSVFIHKGLGDIQKEVAIRYSSTPSVFEIAQVQQMILLGDPAMKLFGAKKADYEINDNNLFIESFTGEPISVTTDSFALRIIVRNFGQAKEKPLSVQVKRTFNDNSTATYQQVYDPVKYADTLLFVVKKDQEKGFGNNSFTVKVDSDDTVDELDETNNGATKSFLIPLNGTKNVFPSDFSIVNGTAVNLVFQTTDLLSGERDFNVEVDTAATFNSPFKMQFTVKGTVLAKQSITILSKDSTAYYWRTKLAQPLSGESTDWVMNSFTYIDNGSAGWAQIHFPQYQKNSTAGLTENNTDRRLEFDKTVTDISVTTFGSASSISYTNVSVKLNNAEYNLYTQGGGCRTNTLNILAFHKTTTVPYLTVPFFNPRSCGRAPQIIHSFAPTEMDTGNGDDIAQMVDNTILGDSVVLFTMGDASFSTWSSTVKNKLGLFGVSLAQISSFQAGEPIIIFGKKGATPGTAKIYRSSASPVNQQTLQVDATLTGSNLSGDMKSPTIGPAQQWQNFSERIKEKESQDDVSFDIVGISFSGEQTVLFTDVSSSQNLSSVDASKYPFLQLVYHVSDSTNLTPTQLHNWFVIYEPVAEGLLVYKGSTTQQSVQEGLDWSNEYSFVNISDRDFQDSLVVQYEFFNKTTRTLQKKQFNIVAPSPSDTTKFKIGTSTFGLGGLNDVTVFVNPYLQPEQYYDNNTLELADFLFVESDIYNPVLNVLIDGRVIENGDFVSANPKIEAQVWDENSVILKTDTIGVNIYMQYPCASEDCTFKRIPMSDSHVKWYPATTDSYFKVDYTPENLPEGNYILKVEAQDANGNGADPYQITFNVKYEDSLVFYTPHPNPSQSAFNFTFLATGETAPDYFSLVIESVEGKILSNIKLSDESFHVGLNTLIWDGTDASGNGQPAGIYIYHLVINSGSRTLRKSGKLIVQR